MHNRSMAIGLFLLFTALLNISRVNAQAQPLPHLVKDFGMSPGSPAGFLGADLNGKYVTDSFGTLLISDGTDTGTHSLKAFYNISAMLVVNGKLFMIACDTLAHGSELWVSNGTAAGTYLVKEINPNPNASGIMYFNFNDYSLTAFNNKVYFYGNDGVHGVELWKSDGTDAGTTMVKDINTIPGANILSLSSFPLGALKAAGSKLFFSADEGTNGAELWVTDGTATGTHMVTDLLPGMTGSNPQYLTPLVDKMCFWASDGIDSGIFITDGTDTGTHILASHIYTPNSESAIIGSKLYFLADTISMTGTSALWVTDGTPAGTLRLDRAFYLTIQRSSKTLLSAFLTAWNSKLYFAAVDILWTSNTTPGTTEVLKDITTLPDICCTPTQITIFGSKIYMRTRAHSGRSEILVSDGTDTGTHPVQFIGADFSPGPTTITDGYLSKPLTVVGNKLFFWNTYTNGSGHALYTIDLPGLDASTVTGNHTATLYPNPATDKLNISLPPGYDLFKIEIIGIDGRMIKALSVNGSNHASIDLKSCPGNSLLIVKMYTSKGIITQKIEHQQ